MTLKKSLMEKKLLKQNTYMIIINASLSLFTLILMIYNIYIAGYTRKMVENSDSEVNFMKINTQQTTNTIDIISLQAKLSKEYNELTSENFITQERAYILLTGDKNYNLFKSDMYTTLDFKNTGTTPAFDIYAFGETAIKKVVNGKIEIGQKYITTCNNGYNKTGIYSLGSGESSSNILIRTDYSDNFIDKFSDEDVGNLQSDGSVAYLFRGTICYKDIFKHKHHTDFCRYYINGTLLRKGTWTACDDENEFD